jgi:anti-sigma factor RsiW
MSCRRFRVSIIEGEAGTLSDEAARRLSHHLRSCPRCSIEARLARDLLALRGEVPFGVDVTARVMCSIRRLRGIDREDVTPYQLGWSAAAAMMGVVTLIGIGWLLLPELNRGGQELTALVRGLAPALSRLIEPLGALLAVPFKLLGSLLRTLGGLVTLLPRLQSAGVAAATLSFVTMTGTITYFVGRDWRYAAVREEP